MPVSFRGYVLRLKEGNRCTLDDTGLVTVVGLYSGRSEIGDFWVAFLCEVSYDSVYGTCDNNQKYFILINLPLFMGEDKGGGVK